jgi:hypothetical protein
MVQVSNVQLRTLPINEVPPEFAIQERTQERKPALPYQENDYVFWLRIPDLGNASSHT